MPLKFKRATFPDHGHHQPFRERTATSPRGRRDPREIEFENNDENTSRVGMIVVTPHCANEQE